MYRNRTSATNRCPLVPQSPPRIPPAPVLSPGQPSRRRQSRTRAIGRARIDGRRPQARRCSSSWPRAAVRARWLRNSWPIRVCSWVKSSPANPCRSLHLRAKSSSGPRAAAPHFRAQPCTIADSNLTCIGAIQQQNAGAGDRHEAQLTIVGRETWRRQGGETAAGAGPNYAYPQMRRRLREANVARQAVPAWRAACLLPRGARLRSRGGAMFPCRCQPAQSHAHRTQQNRHASNRTRDPAISRREREAPARSEESCATTGRS